MLYYSIRQIARIFSLSHSRLHQLHAQGRGPRRSPQPSGKIRISTADALAWGEQQIERLSSSVFTEKDADRYVAGCQRLRVEEYIALAQQPHQPAKGITAKRKGPGLPPHDIVPVGLPSRIH